ncbi:MAG: hypothetical protein RM347_019945 [Nostoc sp. ChiQUE02]|uniref:hypothetical protein n=1 Tax=Nostoc sp. ChiQUE02 TaxID=3075377 RepID=UPI002AD5A375|nr:hypothetical protein [Nostoc sp. ChiQUE02]MDZ8229795.1 hypothetical protein [Nostoc sp. ChiQUE02]
MTFFTCCDFWLGAIAPHANNCVLIVVDDWLSLLAPLSAIACQFCSVYGLTKTDKTPAK